MPDRPTEVELWRRALEDKTARDYWRSVGQMLERDPEFSAAAAQEFPHGADLAPQGGVTRRDLLQLIGASVALAGLGGCLEPPDGKIMPYVQRPPEVTPGVPSQYATSMVIDGFATGLIAQSREGRPVKIEGNPEHPASLGAAGVLQQASVLGLYDPFRLDGVQRAGMPSSWARFYREVTEALTPGPWFVLHPQSSPVVAELIERIRRRFPRARFSFHAPLERTAAYAATRILYGRPLDAQYDFRAAARVLSLDADFTAAMPMSLRWARDFAARRRLASPDGETNRLYQVETMPSPTGSLADHRLPVRPSEVARVGAAVLAALGQLGRRPPNMPASTARAVTALADGAHRDFARAVARDLAEHGGRSIAIAGDGQPAGTHVLAHLINAALGNVGPGAPVTLTPSALLEPEGGEPLSALAGAIDADQVDALVILEANPAYTAPADLNLVERIARVPRSVHLTLHRNETSRACRWLLPAAHYLESWGDPRAYDGTQSFAQPLIRPLFGSRSAMEVLAAFAGLPDANDHLLVRARWLAQLSRGADDDTAVTRWETLVQRGFAPDSAFAPESPALSWDGAVEALDDAATRSRTAGVELSFEQSPAVYDGRFAHNGWLLELPHPMTKLTWDNAAIISPATAVARSLSTEDVVTVKVGERSVRAPVVVLPGHADDAVTLALGFGRTHVASAARDVGVNAYPLRAPDGGARFVADAFLGKTGDTYPLAFTQEHWELHGRDIAPLATLSEYRAHPELTEHLRGALPTLLPQVFDYGQGEQWAMSIDTSICSGCSACVVACQAENNIPVVGKTGVRRSREMHWLRIDRYFSGSPRAPAVIHQPMMCQHCETAPCEYVCPVYATTHSPDGLNEMVYNRCVGTRFCSNNCPYKVRRFNWFEYHEEPSRLDLQHNPDVTVRARGVMEKCTYCVQRIRRAGIEARIEGRPVRPGEVKTACQQACPTEAIQFGSLSHADAPVATWREQPRAYAVLHHLGTRPRTMYLAKILNPNPELD